MINLALSVPGNFYTDAITKALEKTGNFRVQPLIVSDRDMAKGREPTEQTDTDGDRKQSNLKDMLREYERAGKAPPDVALLGVSVYPGYTLKERQDVIRGLRASTPNCKIVMFIDELVSPEQTDGVKSLKQARLIDGFLYASGTMEYLVATLESV